MYVVGNVYILLEYWNHWNIICHTSVIILVHVCTHKYTQSITCTCTFMYTVCMCVSPLPPGARVPPDGQPYHQGSGVWPRVWSGLISTGGGLIRHAADGTATGGNQLCSSLLSAEVHNSFMHSSAILSCSSHTHTQRVTTAPLTDSMTLCCLHLWGIRFLLVQTMHDLTWNRCGMFPFGCWSIRVSGAHVTRNNRTYCSTPYKRNIENNMLLLLDHITMYMYIDTYMYMYLW